MVLWPRWQEIGLHAVRHSTPTFGNWKMHWVTEGSHCNEDYPDKECPQARGLRVLNQSDWLLYNLDASPGETRNLSVAAYPEVVAQLTRLKQLHEAEPDIFGRSEIRRGADNKLQPCSPTAVAHGCAPHGGTPPPTPHHDPSGNGPWPPVENYTILNQTLPDREPYRKLFCDTTKAASLCEKQAAAACTMDAQCGGFALCDWSSQCSQEKQRGVAFLFTTPQSEHTSPKPFWTTWRQVATKVAEPAESQEQWPLCCQKEMSGDWSELLAGHDAYGW